MKNQALFSSKDESKKLKCRLLQFSFGALGVKALFLRLGHNLSSCYLNSVSPTLVIIHQPFMVA